MGLGWSAGLRNRTCFSFKFIAVTVKVKVSESESERERERERESVWELRDESTPEHSVDQEAEESKSTTEESRSRYRVA